MLRQSQEKESKLIGVGNFWVEAEAAAANT